MDNKNFNSECIYSDIHNGFSQDFNSMLSCVFCLLVGILGVLGGYGYIFINSEIIKLCNKLAFRVNDLYTYNALTFATLGVAVALWGIIRVLIYQGFAGRYQQFIIYEIRRRNGVDPSMSDSVFPTNFHPFEKTGWNIMLGLYGVIAKILIVICILVYLATFFRFIFSICCDKPCLCVNSSVLIISILLIFIDLKCFWNKKSKTYKIYEIDYKNKKKTNN